jgi:hypothetical protein
MAGYASVQSSQIECDNVNRPSIASTTPAGGLNQLLSSRIRPHQAQATTVSHASNAVQTRAKS